MQCIRVSVVNNLILLNLPCHVVGTRVSNEHAVELSFDRARTRPFSAGKCERKREGGLSHGAVLNCDICGLISTDETFYYYFYFEV